MPAQQKDQNERLASQTNKKPRCDAVDCRRSTEPTKNKPTERKTKNLTNINDLPK